MTSASSEQRRIVSLDQFRGYCVAGMFVVNFVAGLAAIHPVFSHHNTYFSYADSIMPGFLFVCGFSYRLTWLRRIPKVGARKTYIGYVQRSLALVMVSLVMYGFGGGFSTWAEVSTDGMTFLARLLKANLWEVLAIIGATQLFVLPLVARGLAARCLAAVFCLALHITISHSFNFAFVYGSSNWMDLLWGTDGTRAWDGGLFGIMMWSVAMICGTIAYDIVFATTLGRAACVLSAVGVMLMSAGYCLSCLTRLYDVPPGERVDLIASSPVFPDISTGSRPRGLSELLAEPPFCAPPPPEVRQWNYWMMGKRVVSASFILFGSGFAFATFAVFVVACDLGGRSLGVFRTFGQNPLAAYVIHHMVLVSVRPLAPDDSPLWYCLCSLAAFMGVTYVCVRALEKQQVYLRL